MSLINEVFTVLKVYSRSYTKLDCILHPNWFSFNNSENLSKILWGPIEELC